MESLAALVAGIFVGLITISVIDVVFAILYRRKKVKLWVAATINTLVGIAALWGVGVYWTLAVPTILGLAISSIILTWPRKNEATE